MSLKQVVKHLQGRHSQSSHNPHKGGLLTRGGGPGYPIPGPGGFADQKRYMNQETFHKAAEADEGIKASTDKLLGFREGSLKNMNDQAAQQYYRGLITLEELASKMGRSDQLYRSMAAELTPGQKGTLRLDARLGGPGKPYYERVVPFSQMSEEDAAHYGRLYAKGLYSLGEGGPYINETGVEVANRS